MTGVRIRAAFLLGVMTTWPSAARAEEEPEPDVQEIVVTATRVETTREDAAVRVTVITEEEVRATGARSIDEVLRATSEAVVVGDSLHQGAKPQVCLRGVPDQSRTLVLMDGVPLNAA